MPDSDPPPELDLVAQRIEFLTHLRERPQHKPDLVEDLDTSRSTVDRAIRELEVSGLVERTDDGFATTATGAAMTDGYRAYVHEQESLLAAQELLDVLPASTPLAREAVVDAEVHTAKGPTPYEPLEHVERAIRDAERIRGLVPTVSNPHTVRLCRDRACDADATVELVLSPELHRSLGGRLEGLLAEMAREDEVSLAVGEQPGFTLLVADCEDTTEVVVAVYDDNDALRGVLVNESDAAVWWAEGCFHRVDEDAEDVTDDLATDPAESGAEDGATRDDSGTEGAGGTGGTGETAGTGESGGTGEPAAMAASDGDAATTDAGGIPTVGAAGDATVGAAGDATVGAAGDATAGSSADHIGELFQVQLAAEGVVRVDETYFDSREPAPPAVAWRTGLDLVDVQAGYAVDRERERDGGRENVTESLTETLLAGDDVVVVGPPGAGKSTICKQVACRWHEADHGAVFYRESGADERFASVAKLENQLRGADGTALVVFEDAVREEANAVFEVMRALDGRDDVAFLLDARETEWRNPEEFPVDASLEAYRQAAVETVRVPPLDDVEGRRLIRRFEELVEADPDPSAERLLADVHQDAAAGDGPGAGGLFLLLHRLSTYADPLADHDEAVTSLDQDVAQVYRSLADAGDLAVDVGVLVNLLNAADVGLYPGYVHALAGRNDGALVQETNGDGDDHDQIRNALDRLEGRVVFSRGDADAYRAVHASWSTHFLAHSLAVESEPQRRFGRCVSALLSLADDPDLRERIDWELRGSILDRVESAPAEWVDETVSKLFGLGRNRPKLAPLYGTTDYSRIELPAACSPDTRLRCTAWRGRMYVAAGLVDDAQAEFERLEELLDEGIGRQLDEAVETELVVESLQGQSDVARQRGALDDAAEYAGRALELARGAGDDRATARSLRDLGRVAKERGDLDEAEAHLVDALETFGALGAKQAVAATLADLGAVAEERGDLDESIEYHERSLDARQTVGDQRGEATCLRRLGAIAARRGDYERAERHHVRSLELARTVGDRRGEATTLKELGSVAMMQGTFDDAEEYYRRSLELARELDDQEAVVSALGNLGNVANMRGDLAAATEYYDRTLRRAESIGDRRTQALVHRNLDVLYGRKDDLETAEEHARRALQLHREIGNRLGEVKASIDLGRLALRVGDLDVAETRLGDALELAREVGSPRDEAAALEYLGIVAHRRGDLEQAETRLTDGLELHGDRGHPSGEADCRKRLGKLAVERGDLDAAAEFARAARETFAEIGNDLAEANCRTLLGCVALQCGELEEAASHLEAALDRTRDHQYTLPEVRALRVRSALARTHGDLEAARSDAKRSLSLARETGDVYDQANALVELGDAERADGQRAAARDHYEAALERYREMGAARREIEVLDRLVEVAESPSAASEWCRQASTLAERTGSAEDRERFQQRLDRLEAQ